VFKISTIKSERSSQMKRHLEVGTLLFIDETSVQSTAEDKKNSGFRVLFEFTCQAQDKVRESKLSVNAKNAAITL
jgi:hypothetical protein